MHRPAAFAARRREVPAGSRPRRSAASRRSLSSASPRWPRLAEAIAPFGHPDAEAKARRIARTMSGVSPLEPATKENSSPHRAGGIDPRAGRSPRSPPSPDPRRRRALRTIAGSSSRARRWARRACSSGSSLSCGRAGPHRADRSLRRRRAPRRRSRRPPRRPRGVGAASACRSSPRRRGRVSAAVHPRRAAVHFSRAAAPSAAPRPSASPKAVAVAPPAATPVAPTATATAKKSPFDVTIK